MIVRLYSYETYQVSTSGMPIRISDRPATLFLVHLYPLMKVSVTRVIRLVRLLVRTEQY